MTVKLVCVALLSALAACRSPEPSRVLNDPVAGAADGAMSVEAMIERARTRDYWPNATTEWRLAPEAERQALLGTPACREFTELLMPPASNQDPEKLRTDGVMVVKGGQVWWEAY